MSEETEVVEEKAEQLECELHELREDEINSDPIISSKEILDDLKSLKRPPVRNDYDEITDDGIDLGQFKKVSKENAHEVYDKLPGTLFQIKDCMFRISYINEGQNRFTCELVNGEK